jgi:hypothetical protein
MSTIVATGTVTINAAFMQEIKEVDEDLLLLLRKIRHASNRPIALSQCCRTYVNMLLELRDQLALHFALEEAYGYFDDPIDVAPHIAHEAERLREEHRRLYSQLSRLCENAERMLDFGEIALLAMEIPERFAQFDANLNCHEHRENVLLMQALDDDIGYGD